MFSKLSLVDDFAWRDVFDFLSPTDDREKLARISEFGDRRFSGICQKWLHEWAKSICIGKLRICSNPNGGLALKTKGRWVDETTSKTSRRFDSIIWTPLHSNLCAECNPSSNTSICMCIAIGESKAAHTVLIHFNFSDENTTSPSCFFIQFLGREDHEAIPVSTILNARSNEQLVVKKSGESLRIGRYPSDVDGDKWMEKMKIKINESNVQKHITIAYPTRGPFDGEHEDDDKDFNQPAGPSK